MSKQQELDIIPDWSEWDMPHNYRVAWRKCGSIPGWEVCGWEIIDDDYFKNPDRLRRADTIIKGGIPRIVTRGKYKGRPTWDKSGIRRAVVTDAEVKEEIARYIRETGKCYRCSDKKEVFNGWNREEGTTYSPCPVCITKQEKPEVSQ
jgi:hypothetical protein